MANGLNTWADHLERQQGVANYMFTVSEPGEYLLEVRASGLTIVPRDWRPALGPITFKVELDNAPITDPSEG